MTGREEGRPFIKVPAIRVEQPLGEFYAAAIPARKLLEVCYTDRLRAITEGDSYRLEGSQRLINEPRLKVIGRYIETREAAFPNSVILAANYSASTGLSVQDDAIRWRIESHTTDGGCLELVIPSKERLAPIIDGQHRLFGFAYASDARLDTPVLCSIFLDLPRPYQAYLFATINSTQKPVDRSQTYELFGYNIEEEQPELWSPEKLAVFLTRKLNTDIESPLYQRVLVAAENDFAISRAEAKAENRWMISTATVVDGITRLISTSPKKDADTLRTGREKTRLKLADERSGDKAPLRELYINTRDKVLLGAVSNFFLAVLDVCGPELPAGSYLTKTVGVQALFDTLRKLAPAALEAKDFSRDWFAEKLRPLGEIDFTNEAFQQASGQGRTQIRRVIFHKINLDETLTTEQRDDIEQVIKAATK
ncbi:DNA phosphorothioation-associated DGQHR protein 1 [Rhizobium sp. L1K21]|uniref:DNA phosphorothioation-associated DGQHR protein 1 n=1 Tax=Rhizobium sp. L1K21 TaxID=2954933 RepID=UPI002093A686|nr:DNA phosphorothioation-associated DGQHR protein 1 [Rhizobium sp. L1K21]MCO6185217.1 DNA phosphorothioation-associated DGQHR protein 1 [Rhizobium sp. L1K21]